MVRVAKQDLGLLPPDPYIYDEGTETTRPNPDYHKNQ
jgi:hypothetical protein